MPVAEGALPHAKGLPCFVENLARGNTVQT